MTNVHGDESPLFTSFRDPENWVIQFDGMWFRVARGESARALRRLRNDDVYSRLIDSKSIPSFSEVDLGSISPKFLSVIASHPNYDESDLSLFSVDTFETISYPWEWPDELLAAAGLLTLKVRLELLSIGLDLKDASALNIQFDGSVPMLLDIGSIEEWRPNPSWNAVKQFVEHFVNPLALGLNPRLSSAWAWKTGGQDGVETQLTRSIMSWRPRKRFGLWLVQQLARPKPGNETFESRFSRDSISDPQLALQSTVALTKRLQRQTERLLASRGARRSTWADYGTRDHYSPESLESKHELVEHFVKRYTASQGLVLDLGGNDGLVAHQVVSRTDRRVVVVDPDTGALSRVCEGLDAFPSDQARLMPLVGDIRDLWNRGGLLGLQYQGLAQRVKADAVLCQAVLHHVVITQGVPLGFVVDALASLRAPLQIEFALPDDDKVKLLKSQLSKWSGSYSCEDLLKNLRRHYRDVQVVGRTSETRVVVEAVSPRSNL